MKKPPPFNAIVSLGTEKQDIIDGQLLKGVNATQVARQIQAWGDSNNIHEKTLARQVQRYYEKVLVPKQADLQAEAENAFDFSRLEQDYDSLDLLLQMAKMQGQRVQRAVAVEQGKLLTKAGTDNLKFMLDIQKEISNLLFELGHRTRAPKTANIGIMGVSGPTEDQRQYDADARFREKAIAASNDIMNIIDGECEKVENPLDSVHAE
ncbi:MAG: hypothetical protein QNJ97_29405 [Myxococcota bacterium]|nr:hypothetical protein [Myxococcota bacterium]